MNTLYEVYYLLVGAKQNQVKYQMMKLNQKVGNKSDKTPQL